MVKKKAFKLKQITEEDFNLPDNLSTYLNKSNLLLLKCFLANYNIQETCKFTKYTRKEIINRFISLGKALLTFHLLETKIFPKQVSSADYLKGWNDCKKEIRRLSDEQNIRGQTLKSRNT